MKYNTRNRKLSTVGAAKASTPEQVNRQTETDNKLYSPTPEKFSKLAKAIKNLDWGCGCCSRQPPSVGAIKKLILSELFPGGTHV